MKLTKCIWYGDGIADDTGSCSWVMMGNDDFLVPDSCPTWLGQFEGSVQLQNTGVMIEFR